MKKDTFAIAAKLLQDNSTQERDYKTAYGVVKPDGSSTRYSYNCHSSLRQSENYGADLIWTTLWKDEPLLPEAGRAFFDWITDKDQSPWREVIPSHVYEDKEWTYKYGFILSTNFPSNQLGSFFVVSRSLAQHPLYVNHWYKLVSEHSFDPAFTWAYIGLFIGMGTNSHENPPMNTARFAYSDKWEWMLDVHTYDESYVYNFCKGNIVGTLNKPFRESSIYTPINSIWSKGWHEKMPKWREYVRSTYKISGSIPFDEYCKIGLSEQERILG